MEYLIVALFYIVQFVIGAIAYRNWMKKNSHLVTAKAQLFDALKSHYEAGTLSDYLEGIVTRKSPLVPSRPLLRPSVICVTTMVIGVALMFVPIKLIFPGLHIAIKVIITFISVTPFIIVAFIGIAQEVDDIRIMNFARSIRDRFLSIGENEGNNQNVEEVIAWAEKL